MLHNTANKGEEEGEEFNITKNRGGRVSKSCEPCRGQKDDVSRRTGGELGRVITGEERAVLSYMSAGWRS